MKDVTGESELCCDLDFALDSLDADTQIMKHAIELNQGRAAQMGILALMVHEKLVVPILSSN
jgi:hypothetical protein